MDIDKTADEAAGRVLDQIERDGSIHRSSIARVIADEMHRANRKPYMMMEGPQWPAAWLTVSPETVRRGMEHLAAALRKNDPG